MIYCPSMYLVQMMLLHNHPDGILIIKRTHDRFHPLSHVDIQPPCPQRPILDASSALVLDHK